MNEFKKLKVWQKALDLAVLTYKYLHAFPVEEKFGLTQQLKRCAVSIPANIAEGAGRNSGKEFYHFLGIANGSSYELETELILAQRLGFISEPLFLELETQIGEVQRMLYALMATLKS